MSDLSLRMLWRSLTDGILWVGQFPLVAGRCIRAPPITKKLYSGVTPLDPLTANR